MPSSTSSVAALLAMLVGSVVPTEAWTTAQPHLMRAASTASSSSPSSSPASPLTGVPSLSTRAVTRWDEHLNLAKREHHRKNWGQVRRLCTGVISIADDWTAVEQAHLRLALAEQKDERVDAARRAFQEGTEACPSSDTLFMAWALMESKIHNARSRKAARALLRRAVALNPKRHSDVLKWRVFLDWKEAGEAAVEAVRSALSSGEGGGELGSATASSPSSSPSSLEASPPLPPLPSAVGAGAGAYVVADTRSSSSGNSGGDTGSRQHRHHHHRQGISGSESGASSSHGRSAAAASATAVAAAYSGVAAVPTTAEEAAAAGVIVPATAGTARVGSAVVAGGGVGESSSSSSTPTLSWTTRAAEAVHSERTRTRAEEERERGLASDLLALCKTVGDDLTAEHDASTTLGVGKGTREKVMAKHEARFEELAGELEKTEKGVTGGAAGEGGERELSGSWRLVFTTCTTCDRILLRAGSDFYQRLTPPITEIARRPGDSSAPFQCEVLLRPFCWSNKKTEGEACSPSTPESGGSGSTQKSGKKACVAYFLRGWAHAPTHKRASGERLLLRQQVAPRSAVVVRRDSSAASGAGHTRVPSATPPQSLFSALGQVARGGKGLEKVATQEVTYVGERLRIGRTADGEVYVYERCAWPEDMLL